MSARPSQAEGERPAPYLTRLDILRKPLELAAVQALVDACTHPRCNPTLCKVNDSVVRLGE